jgi:catechol 2,3-dioxygenase-like lactoylglutathione lyase family enzyme
VLKSVSHVGIWVLDQDQAHEYYTTKLGLEVREDATMADFRWLTVGPPGQPDLELILLVPGPPPLDPETAERVKALVAEGAMGGVVFSSDDVRRTYDELSARGVEFHQEPMERPYGIDAAFRDPFGNSFRITQRTAVTAS